MFPSVFSGPKSIVLEIIFWDLEEFAKLLVCQNSQKVDYRPTLLLTAKVPHQKWATMISELLRLLTKNDRMSESLVFLSKSLICSFFAKNKQFAQKTDERIPSPATTTVVTLDHLDLWGLAWLQPPGSSSYTGQPAPPRPWTRRTPSLPPSFLPTAHFP